MNINRHNLIVACRIFTIATLLFIPLPVMSTALVGSMMSSSVNNPNPDKVVTPKKFYCGTASTTTTTSISISTSTTTSSSANSDWWQCAGYDVSGKGDDDSGNYTKSCGSGKVATGINIWQWDHWWYGAQYRCYFSCATISSTSSQTTPSSSASTSTTTPNCAWQ